MADEIPTLEEIAADTKRYLDTPEACEVFGNVLRANVLALNERPDVPKFAIAKLAHIARIIAQLMVELAETRKQVILLAMESSSQRTH